MNLYYVVLPIAFGIVALLLISLCAPQSETEPTPLGNPSRPQVFPDPFADATAYGF